MFLAGTNELQLRVYGQKADNTIQEYLWDGELDLQISGCPLLLIWSLGHGWKEGTNLGPALPGTGIGATSFHYTELNGPSVR